MKLTDSDIRKFCRDTVAYASNLVEPVLVYWSRHNRKFSKTPARNQRGDKTWHIVGVYNRKMDESMVEEDIRNWIANRPKQET